MRSTDRSGDRRGIVRRLWLWPLAILVSLPIGGYVADLVVDGVDSVGAALVGGLIAGAIFGAAEWFVLRRRVSWLWIPATVAGMAVGLVAGAALVDYGIGRADLALMGAVNGVGVGVMQALVLARHRIPGALWWAVANPPGWALGWFVTSYVISRNIDERFPIFGASGAIVFGLLTWLLLAGLIRAAPGANDTARRPPVNVRSSERRGRGGDPAHRGAAVVQRDLRSPRRGGSTTRTSSGDPPPRSSIGSAPAGRP